MEQQAPRLAGQPLIEALGRLSEPERRAVSRGLRLLRSALAAGG